MLTACQTTVPGYRHRKIPPVRACTEILDRVAFRDQFFKALRGKARFESSRFGASADVELAVLAPNRARLEFTGPLGVRIALLLVNEKWVYLYVPRENSVLRFPAAELSRNTVRRERFFEMLPLPVIPEALFQGLLTSVAGASQSAGISRVRGVQCEVDKAVKAYRIRIPGNSISVAGGRFVWVDGEDFFPLRVAYFERLLPAQWEEGVSRPSFEINYSEISGSGVATIPHHFELQVDGEKALDFEWVQAEVWEVPNLEVFNWRPAASMEVRDY